MTSNDLSVLSPDYVRAIAPYQPGKPISEVARELGLAERDIIKLASNENPRGPSPKAVAAISAAAPELTRYPDGNGFELKAALAGRFGVSMEQIVLGNGSNDILELVALAFLGRESSGVYSEFGFAVYPLAIQARGAQPVVVPARDYGHDLQAMRAAVRDDTRIVYIANPNNPTGTFIAGSALEAFIASVPRDVIVVVDEAYNEYLPEKHRYDSVAWLGRHPNLILSRTFSKAYGLAALRVGYGLMSPVLADLLNRVRQPFNVNSLAQVAAVASLADTEYVRESHEINRAGLARLEAGLERLGVPFVPSVGNFVLIEVGDAGRVFEALLRQGVIVRPVGGYGLPRHLRVTVGLPAENERFLSALAGALQPR
jgi:histidinol-phosphate aminotransferase